MSDSDFWRQKCLEDLAGEQGVEPIEDFDQFLEAVGAVWPEDETCVEFIAWLRDPRHQEDSKPYSQNRRYAL